MLPVVVPTLVVSDLHLGGRTRHRRPALRGATARRCSRRSRRSGSSASCCSATRSSCATARCAEALEAARGRSGRRSARRSARAARSSSWPATTTTTSSQPWMERRRRDGTPPPLGLEERARPRAGEAARDARPLVRAGLASSSRYPGVWLRDDVYATHGHYLDRHITVPTFERLAAGVMSHVVGRLPERRGHPRRLRGRARPDLRLGAHRRPAGRLDARHRVARRLGARVEAAGGLGRPRADPPLGRGGRLPARDRRPEPGAHRAGCAPTSRARASAAPACAPWARRSPGSASRPTT